MTALVNIWTTATASSLDRLRRVHEPAELLGVLGGCLWAMLVFMIVHFAKS